jgi:hypothetical protein
MFIESLPSNGSTCYNTDISKTISSRDNTVGIATRYKLDDPGSIP